MNFLTTARLRHLVLLELAHEVPLFGTIAPLPPNMRELRFRATTSAVGIFQ